MTGRSGGRGKGRGCGRKSARQSNKSEPSNLSIDDGDKCNTCDCFVGNDAIGCDRCESWFHPKTLCLGLSETVIQTIVDNGGQGVAYISTDCRAKSLSVGGSNGAGPAFKQLYQTVKMLCKTVETMSLQMTKLCDLGKISAAVPTESLSVPGDVDMVRASIREEVREVEEQNKRKNSVIVRGLNVANEEEAGEKFKEVTRTLIGREISLSDVVCISRNKEMYRAKIVSDASRMEVLAKAKELPNFPDLQNVFFHRDLTFKQRQSLW